MLLHTGYLKNVQKDSPIKGACFGVGGKLSFTLSDHFRLGAEGYTSTYSYDEQPGYFKLGWGGILSEYQIFKKSSLSPVLGLTVGGGRIHDLYFRDYPTTTGDYSVDYQSSASLFFSPSVSLEYLLKSKLTLVLQVVFVSPLVLSSTKANIEYAYGPRVYLGMLFNRR
jgi:hypothetical protein